MRPDRYEARLFRRFFGAIDVGTSPGGCWFWTGGLFEGGYRRFKVKGRGRLAHRVAYELLVGPIPLGLHLDHLCRERACVNPLHLEPTTPLENARRAFSPKAAKTHCDAGHPFDEGNTYRDPRGWRGCRACRQEATRRWEARQ